MAAGFFQKKQGKKMSFSRIDRFRANFWCAPRDSAESAVSGLSCRALDQTQECVWRRMEEEMPRDMMTVRE
jgi:hypothetical protein